MSEKSKSRPLDFLNKLREKKVQIELRGNKRIIGTLINYDSHLNMTLHNAKEFKTEGEADLGVIVVRGDNIIFVHEKNE
jgi:small nuclear ribonucleoprotein